MRILLVEDDRKLNETMTYQLHARGILVDSCFDGENALFYAQQDIYDVILLDRMLPAINGSQVLTSLRKKGIQTPVILITALGTLQDRISGLDQGADDYLVKPFAFEELMARIRCVTRRPHTITDNYSLSFFDITYHADQAVLSGPVGNCTLSRRESALLEVFLRNKNKTLSRDTLLLKIWGPDSDVEDGNLDNYIHFLRRRLKTVGSRAQLKTIRGIGYCITAQNESFS